MEIVTLSKYLTWICLGIGFIISIYVSKKYWKGYLSLKSNILSSFGHSIATIALTCLSFGILCGIFFEIYSSSLETTEVEKHYLYPVSINREKDIEGAFVLGSGTIQSVNYYYFYYKSIYGYKLSKIDATDAYIIETNSRRPEIVHIVNRYPQKDVLIKLRDSSIKIRTIIYVPKGTIIKQYTLQ